MPSQLYDIPPEEIDREHERAFILAAINKQAKDEKKAREKAKAQARSRRRGH